MGQAIMFHNPGNTWLPYDVKMKFPDESSNVQECLLSMRSETGRHGRRYVTDLVGATGWVDLPSSARGWTVTLSNSTASASETTIGINNVAAEIDGTSPNAGWMVKRVRVTRTTKLDSLRGVERCFIRARPTVSNGEWELQLRWGMSASVGGDHQNAKITITPGSTLYKEWDLGNIDVPTDPSDSIGGIALEIWASRVAGAGDLILDMIRLLPSGSEDVLTRVSIPQTAMEEYWGAGDLASPVSNPSGGTAAASVSGDIRVLDTVTDNIGTPTNSGIALTPGHHWFDFDIQNGVLTATPHEGNTLTNKTGSEVTVGTDKEWHWVGEGVYREETPGASYNTVTAQFSTHCYYGWYRVTFRIWNQTDGIEIIRRNLSVTPEGSLTRNHTWPLSFVALAGKTYRYYLEMEQGHGHSQNTIRIDYMNVDKSTGTAAVAGTKFVVRNITDSTDTITSTGVSFAAGERKTVTLDFDAVGGKLYQAQVDDPTSTTLGVVGIGHRSNATVGAQNQSLLTNPQHNQIEKLTSDDTLIGLGESKGPVPFWLPPGLAAGFVVPLDTDQSLKARTVNVSGRGSPRYY